MTEKRHWLRGGVKGVLVCVVFFFISFINLGLISFVFYIVFLALPSFFVSFIGDCALNGFDGINPSCPSEWTVILSAFAVNLLIYFILGAVIGLIYGKIGNQKFNES